VRAFASSRGYANAFRCRDCILRLHDSEAEAQGGTKGIGIYTAGGSVVLRDVNATAQGATDNWGIYTDGDMTLVDVEALGRGGTNATGFFVGEGNGTVRHSALMATGATTSNEGLSSYTDYNTHGVFRTVSVHGSTIEGASVSVYRASYVNIRIAGSQLKGSVTQGSDASASGAYTCFNDYGPSFAPVTCP
jgi:hypothetical protein